MDSTRRRGEGGDGAGRPSVPLDSGVPQHSASEPSPLAAPLSGTTAGGQGTGGGEQAELQPSREGPVRSRAENSGGEQSSCGRMLDVSTGEGPCRHREHTQLLQGAGPRCPWSPTPTTGNTAFVGTSVGQGRQVAKCRLLPCAGSVK